MFPPYTYPDSSVLINRRNIRDAATLDTLERKTTLLYLSEMAEQLGDFDVVHLKRIHAVLFHDLYAWARQFRLVASRDENAHETFQWVDTLISNLKRLLMGHTMGESGSNVYTLSNLPTD